MPTLVVIQKVAGKKVVWMQAGWGMGIYYFLFDLYELQNLSVVQS